MPGGNPTLQQTRLDLRTYLTRKRLPPRRWLAAHSITTAKALEAFLEAGNWSVDALTQSELLVALPGPTESIEGLVGAIVREDEQQPEAEEAPPVEPSSTLSQQDQPPPAVKKKHRTPTVPGIREQS